MVSVPVLPDTLASLSQLANHSHPSLTSRNPARNPAAIVYMAMLTPCTKLLTHTTRLCSSSSSCSSGRGGSGISKTRSPRVITHKVAQSSSSLATRSRSSSSSPSAHSSSKWAPCTSSRSRSKHRQRLEDSCMS